MGKNKTKGINSDPMKQKTQELEDTTRISKGYHKNNPTKPKWDSNNENTTKSVTRFSG